MQPDQHRRTPDLRPYLEREFKSLAHTWPVGTPVALATVLDTGSAKAVPPVADRRRSNLCLEFPANRENVSLGAIRKTEYLLVK